MANSLFYAFFLSLLIGTALTPILIIAAKSIGLVDHPGHRKVHKEPIARAGGLAFAIGALIAMGIWSIGHSLITGIVLGTIIIILTGSLDDYLDLRASHKLLAQLVAATVTTVYSQLEWQPLFGVFGYEIPQWFAMMIIIIMLVLITNAINFSDGLDGLAGGVTFLSFGTIAYMAYQINDVIVLFLTLPVMGGLLGFLRFNTFPARVFMGDGGSQFLGFLMGTVAILFTDLNRTPFSPLLLLFLVGVPLLDMLAVTTQRLIEQSSPFRADQQHLHHKLLAIGFSHHQVVLIIYALQGGMVLTAYFLRWAPDFLLAGVYLVILTSIMYFFYLVSSNKLQADAIRTASAGILYWRTWLHSVPWLSKVCVQGLGVGIIGFLIFGLFIASGISKEIAMSAIGIVILLVLSLISNTTTIPSVARMGLYLGSTFVLYLTHNFLHAGPENVQIAITGFFGLLVTLLILAIHLDEKKQFQVNPMDYLLLFLALIIPFLPQIQVSGINLGLLISRLIILFFCCEVLLQAFSSKALQLGYVSALVLLGIGIQGFL